MSEEVNRSDLFGTRRYNFEPLKPRPHWRLYSRIFAVPGAENGDCQIANSRSYCVTARLAKKRLGRRHFPLYYWSWGTLVTVVLLQCDKSLHVQVVLSKYQWRRSCGGPDPPLLVVCTDPHFLVPCCYTWLVIHSISSADSG